MSDDSEWQLLRERFRLWTGIVLQRRPLRPVLAVAKSRARSQHMPLSEYLDHLGTSEKIADRDALIDKLVNGTTWFMRDRDGIDALVSSLGERAKTKDRRRVDVWSAGCSTGQEPYSIAMALTQAGLEPHVLATDVSRASLRSARAGEYRASSLQKLPPGFRELYFEPARAGSMRATQSLRRCVTFKYHNLAHAERPPVGWDRFDAMICRNVLLYFEREHAIASFHKMAKFCDTILLSATEQPLSWLTHTSSVIGGGNAVLLDSKRVRNAKPIITSQWPVPPPRPQAPRPQRVETSPRSNQPRATESACNETLAAAEAHFRQGALDKAIEALDAVLILDPLMAHAQLARGLILRAAGQTEEAVTALRCARFLLADQAWLPPYQLGSCLEELGEVQDSIEAYRHALSVIELGRPSGLTGFGADADSLARTVAGTCRAKLASWRGLAIR